MRVRHPEPRAADPGAVVGQVEDGLRAIARLVAASGEAQDRSGSPSADATRLAARHWQTLADHVRDGLLEDTP
jgi:hypothetical protein